MTNRPLKWTIKDLLAANLGLTVKQEKAQTEAQKQHPENNLKKQENHGK